ncbi:hypothetical protein [Alistipes sp.]|uniref:hypothetical protein n=1 Tax=Alistipes sp. TaxID=1872444 RepID=UPI003AF010E8
MKKFFVLLACSLFAAAAVAQGRYAVYKIEGTVELKTPQGWTAAAKRAGISAIDVLRLAPEARVGIIDNTSNRIFYSAEAGEQRVGQIINSAKRRADRITGQMNEQIRRSVASNAAEGYTHESVGASYRGMADGSTTESVYASLCEAIARPPVGSDERLVLRKVATGDGDFYFAVSNRSAEALYVNVLALSERLNFPVLCFNLGYSCDEPYMLVPPHAELAVEHFVFAGLSDDDTVYLLFGSAEPFDTQELQTLFANAVKSTVSEEQRASLVLTTLGAQ